jgi:hypothetical protein
MSKRNHGSTQTLGAPEHSYDEYLFKEDLAHVPQRRRMQNDDDDDDDDDSDKLHDRTQRRRVANKSFIDCAAHGGFEIKPSVADSELTHKPGKRHGGSVAASKALTPYQELDARRHFSESALAAMSRVNTGQVERLQAKLGVTSPGAVARMMAGLHVSSSSSVLPFGGRRKRRASRARV